jgi:hypothetical protein
MNAFLTGSRAYGTPRPDSDVDLCVLLSHDDLEALALQAPQSNGEPASGDENDASLRFGRLNVIAMTDPSRFAAWKEATVELVARKPVTRDQAVKLIDEKVRAAKDADWEAHGEFLSSLPIDEESTYEEALS